MNYEQKQPYKIYQAGGRKFPVYIEYDEQLEQNYLDYPNFEENPEYTREGRPFVTAEQERCLHCKPQIVGEPLSGDCGGCGWFYREQTPYDPIGVCMCEARKWEKELENEEEKK